MLKYYAFGFTNRMEVNSMNIQTNEKKTKEKIFTKISKFLHNTHKASKIVYEICKVIKSIIDMFQ